MLASSVCSVLGLLYVGLNSNPVLPLEFPLQWGENSQTWHRSQSNKGSGSLARGHAASCLLTSASSQTEAFTLKIGTAQEGPG